MPVESRHAGETYTHPFHIGWHAMEESISGFKMRGDWADIVEHGERIALALRETGADGDAFHEFDDWRPKAHERIDEDVSEKTAEQASVSEGDGEKAGKTPGDDLQTAGEKLTESYEKVEENDTESAMERWGDSASSRRYTSLRSRLR